MLAEIFYLDKAKAINKFFKDFGIPVYCVCSKNIERATGKKKLQFKKIIGESCVEPYENISSTGWNALDNFLFHKYNLSLAMIYKNPDEYRDIAKKKLDKVKQDELAEIKRKHEIELKKSEKLRKKTPANEQKPRYKFIGYGFYNGKTYGKQTFKIYKDISGKFFYYSPSNKEFINISEKSKNELIEDYKNNFKKKVPMKEPVKSRKGKEQERQQARKVAEEARKEARAAKREAKKKAKIRSKDPLKYKYFGTGWSPQGKKFKIYISDGQYYYYSQGEWRKLNKEAVTRWVNNYPNSAVSKEDEKRIEKLQFKNPIRYQFWNLPISEIKKLTKTQFRKVYDILEDENYHLENGLLTAKYIGTAEDVKAFEKYIKMDTDEINSNHNYDKAIRLAIELFEKIYPRSKNLPPMEPPSYETKKEPEKSERDIKAERASAKMDEILKALNN